VKYGSARKCRQKFHDERVASRQTNHNLVNKCKTTGLVIDKKQMHKCQLLTEKLDDIEARLELASRKPLKLLAQEAGVPKSSARTATQLLKPSSESWCPVCCKYKDCCICVFNEQLIAKNIYM
jgi:hypothetical protein